MPRDTDKMYLGRGGTILLAWLTVVVALAYAAVHFIRKFW